MRSLLKIVLGLFLLLALLSATAAYYLIFHPRLNVDSEKELFVKTGNDFTALQQKLAAEKLIHYPVVFEKVSTLMKFSRVHPGRYVIPSEISLKSLVEQLRIGRQQPVKVVLNTLRRPEDLAGIIGTQLEADSIKMMEFMRDSIPSLREGASFKGPFDFVMPDTYEMYWNMDARAFFERMLKEYDKYWTAERKKQASEKGFTPRDVSILAAIVEEETYHFEEMPRIAGVYVNRLKRGWKLQADPTVRYAVGDFTLKRILNKHLSIDSPFNTYLNEGLPPAPICMPSKNAIEAVLSAEDHPYLFFCAKEDFSMYHNFARTHNEHLRNARRYQRALNQRGIR